MQGVKVANARLNLFFVFDVFEGARCNSRLGFDCHVFQIFCGSSRLWLMRPEYSVWKDGFIQYFRVLCADLYAG